MAEQHRQTKDYFWFVVIFGTTGAAITATLVGLKHGSLSVFPHLYYFPIIIVSYLYPRKGTIFSVLLGGVYLFLMYAFAFGDANALAAATVQFYVFVTVGFIASSLSGKLQESEAKFRDITENSPLGIYLTEKGKFRVCKPTLCRDPRICAFRAARPHGAREPRPSRRLAGHEGAVPPAGCG